MRLRIAYAALIGLLLVRAAATFLPSPWLWGLDSLTDRSTWLRVLGIVLFAVVLLPPVARRSAFLACRLSRSRAATASLGALLLGVLLLLGSRNILLGDTQTYLAALEKGVRVAGGAHREPLAQGIVRAVHAHVSAPLGLSAHATFSALGVLFGAIYLAASARLIRLGPSGPSRSDEGDAARLLVLSAVVTGGVLQLYSGYAEYYGVGVALFLVFAALALERLEGRREPAGGLSSGRAWLVAAAYALAIVAHAQIIFAAPAFLYLLWRVDRSGRRREAAFALLLLPILTLLALAILRYPFGDLVREARRGGSFLPPLGQWTSRTAYGIDSPLHLLEVLNVLLLVVPVLPALLALYRRPEAPRGTFLSVLAIGPALFLLAANPQLGFVRDWDVFAIPALAIGVWAAFGAAETLRDSRQGRAGRDALAGALLLTGLLHAGFWIDSNHRPGPAQARIRRVASEPRLFGRESGAETWRFLLTTDVQAGHQEAAIDDALHAIRSDPQDRISYRMAAGLEMSRSARNGEDVATGLARYADEVARAGGLPAFAHHGAALAAVLAGRDDLAFEEGRRMVASEPLSLIHISE
ncbi:MAG: hypothetical protein QUU85_06350, partial [Candidatus Eisenbacteria bacterium]|nr:hypothetical protein [Candidatus Eisenbacteria bacterium]